MSTLASDVGRNETYDHNSSDMKFPVSLGSFARSYVGYMNEARTSVEVHYEAKTAGYSAHLDIFLFPGAVDAFDSEGLFGPQHDAIVNETLDKILAGTQGNRPSYVVNQRENMILKVHDLQAKGEQIDGRFTIKGLFNDNRRIGRLIVVARGPWLMHYRIDYSVDDADSAAPAIERAIRDLGLPYKDSSLHSDQDED